jgi:hypothetical protein
MAFGMTADMKNLPPSGCYKILSAVTIFSAFILFVSCEDNLYKPPAPVATQDFGIVIFDEAGTEGTSFRKGTDIKIGLKLITDGGKHLQWSKDDECRLFSNKDFLRVFQSNESLEKPPTLYFPLGIPYQIPIYCTTMNLPPTYINAGAVIFAFPWSSNPDNEPLVAGRYYTIATFDLIIEGKVKHWELRNDFEIYN